MASAASDSEDPSDIDKLYEYAQRLTEAKDKSDNVSDYEEVIRAAKAGSMKAKQLAAQLIPRFFSFFPGLTSKAVNAHFDLCEEEELSIRVQAIRGLPLLCKDSREYVSKIVDVLGQLLIAEENVERDAVHKALLSLLRQDPKASLTALFHHVVASEDIREKVISFIKDKVFPLKDELLKPTKKMEKHITDLVKKSVQDVTGEEFKMFMDFLKSLSIFGKGSPVERVQELTEMIEGQADLDAQFKVSDIDHLERLMSCMYMALPFFMRGTSNSKFLNYLNTHIIPVFDKVPEERKMDLLKNLAESSPYTTPPDSRQLLPSIVQLLKKHIPQRETGEEMNFTHVECLLYAFHQLACRAPNITNRLCGYKIVTGQPSDRLGEDFSDNYKDFTERLTNLEDLAKATMEKLTQDMVEHNNAMADAKTDEAKSIKNQNTMTGLHTCNNILAMTQPLHSESPSFIGDKMITLSWRPATEPSLASTTAAAGEKRTAPAANGFGAMATKKGRGEGGMQSQLVNRVFEDSCHGGRNDARGWGGHGRGWGGRGRGWGYH